MLRTHAVRSTAFLAGLACCAALAGCDSNPSPAPLPSESPSVPTQSEATDPSPTPPTMPAEAKGTSGKSAKAFVRYYVNALNFATATGDTKLLEARSDAACDSCSSVVDRIRRVYDAGGHIQSDGWKIQSISSIPLQPKKKPILDVGLVLSPQVVVESKGKDAQHFVGGKLPATFHLSLKGEEWVVTKWDRAA